MPTLFLLIETVQSVEITSQFKFSDNFKRINRQSEEKSSPRIHRTKAA